MNLRGIVRCPRCGKRHDCCLWLPVLARIDRTYRCRQCGKLFAVSPVGSRKQDDGKADTLPTNENSARLD